MAFPDFFRNSTITWWKRELREMYTNPRDPEKSLKFDGIWIVSVCVCVCVHGDRCVSISVCLSICITDNQKG